MSSMVTPFDDELTDGGQDTSKSRYNESSFGLGSPVKSERIQNLHNNFSKNKNDKNLKKPEEKVFYDSVYTESTNSIHHSNFKDNSPPKKSQ